MDGTEFIKMVKKIGKREGLEVRLESERGKGSHITLYYGDKFNVVKERKKEIGKGLYNAMLNQLGIKA
jgi:mRNA interferase HicA